MALTDKLTAIANAIRTKTGGVEAMSLDGMVEAVNALEIGGGFPNGTEWTANPVFEYFYYGIRQVIHDESGVWLMACNNGAVYYSTNGVDWTETELAHWTSNTDSGSIIKYNGLFIYAYRSGIYYSTDGISWTASNITSYVSSSHYKYIPYRDKLLLICTANTTNASHYQTSDGKNWTAFTINDRNYVTDVLITEGAIVVSGFNYTGYSTDGVDWTCNTLSVGSTILECHEGVFVLIGTNKGAYYSTDGINWTATNVTGVSSTGTSFIKFLGDKWFLCHNSTVYYSTDGIAWEKVDDVNRLFEYKKGVYVAADSSGGMLYSTDGIEWTSGDLTAKVKSLCYACGLFVAAADNGLYYSVDGINWTLSNISIDSSTTDNHSVCHVDNMWFAVCGRSGVYYSHTWSD